MVQLSCKPAAGPASAQKPAESGGEQRTFLPHHYTGSLQYQEDCGQIFALHYAYTFKCQMRIKHQSCLPPTVLKCTVNSILITYYCEEDSDN